MRDAYNIALHDMSYCLIVFNVPMYISIVLSIYLLIKAYII